MNNPENDVCIPIDSEWQEKTVHAWQARSVFIMDEGTKNACFWHLHPELVETISDDDGTECCCTMLCPHCNEKAKKKE